MFQQPNRIDTVNDMAREAIDALDALPTEALQGAERDRNLCEQLMTEGDIVGEGFREVGDDLLRHLARVEPEEGFAQELDRAIRRLRDAINGSRRIVADLGAECTTSIQRAA